MNFIYIFISICIQIQGGIFVSRVNNSYYAIIGILSIGPMSGYQIKTWVDEGVGYFVDIDYKQIYPTLKRIVDEGLAVFDIEKSGNRPESKVYRLTDKGISVFKEWLECPIDYTKRSTNELMLKFFFGQHNSVNTNMEHLTRYKEYTVNRLQNIKDVKTCLENDRNKDASWHYRMTTVMRGEILLQAELNWCDQTMEYIKDI